MRNAFRVTTAVLGATAIVLSFCYGQLSQIPAVLERVTRFVSYFTILTTVLAVLTMLVPALAPRTAVGRFLERAGVRTAITGYILVVGLVYHFLLRNVWDPHGWGLVATNLLHYVTPALVTLDWLLYVPKGSVRWSNGFLALGFPAAYVAWILGLGAVTQWYPYPFLDVTRLGHLQVVLNICGIIVGFLILELALVVADQWLARLLPQRLWSGRGREGADETNRT